MPTQPQPPETAGDPSGTTVNAAVVAETEGAPAPGSGEPSQENARRPAARSTEPDPDQTRIPPIGAESTPPPGDSSPETRASNDYPSLTSAGISFARDELTGISPGQVAFDLYLVKKKLGEGGMGQVWLVTHRELKVDRALKCITDRVSFDSQARLRFRREAEVLALINHPNAVAVHNARLNEDIPYIEMEYVPGLSLDRVFRAGSPMPLKWIARIVDQLCSVLHAAHERGIVHRDLKPANLMLLDGRPEGEEFLKVLDFGIAKVLECDPSDSELRTGTGMFVGTVAYASPEQLLGAAEPRSDLYSVGVILYEFLTGRRPYLGLPHFILQQAMAGNPPPFAAVDPEIGRFHYPPELEALVLRCLSRDPAARPQTARELAGLFREAVKSEVETAKLPAIEESPPAPSSIRKFVAIGMLACVALGLGVWMSPVLRRGSGTHLDTPPPIKITVPDGFVAASDSRPVANGRPSVIVPVKLPALGLRLLLIEGKKFAMGEGDLRHDEAVSSFYMSETEITNRQMIAFFTAKGISSRPDVWDRCFRELHADMSEAEALDHPAAGISHAMADDFAKWIGAELPTEAEWEFAATCGGLPDRPYPWPYAEKFRRGKNYANIDTSGELNSRTTRVKSYDYDRTTQGIYDLAGNLREWCRDRGAKGDEFAVRGGSWNTAALEYSNQARSSAPGAATELDLGFRIVVEWPRN